MKVFSYRHFKFNSKHFKNFCDKKNSSTIDNKAKIYYEFMNQNLSKDNDSESVDNIVLQDENKLIEILKCPMTEGNLNLCEGGLKIFHITYPRRNGIYILLEEEAKFNF